MRRAELAGLTVADVRDDEFGPHRRVLGKGNRERRVFLEPCAQAAPADWLELCGDQPGVLFCRISKGLGLPALTSSSCLMQPARYCKPNDCIAHRALLPTCTGTRTPSSWLKCQAERRAGALDRTRLRRGGIRRCRRTS